MAPTPESKMTDTSMPLTPETAPVVICGPSTPLRQPQRWTGVVGGSAKRCQRFAGIIGWPGETSGLARFPQAALHRRQLYALCEAEGGAATPTGSRG
jgi:hypothetical protein